MAKGVRFEPSFAAAYQAKRKRQARKKKSTGFSVSDPLADLARDCADVMSPPAAGDSNAAMLALGDFPKWLVAILESDSEVARAAMDKRVKLASPHKMRLAQAFRKPSDFHDTRLAEHWLQVRLFYVVERYHPQIYPFLFAVPNGGYRTPKAAAMMSHEGQKSGVQDMMLAMPRGKYHGLFLEVKTEKGSASKIQKETQALFSGQGYCCLIEKGFERCLNSLLNYYSLPLFDGISIIHEMS